ncbi:MAG: ABC transporter permease [Clostridiales bacterium]|nr:ABC transporter permease [Clostridiales bacterium]
MLGYTIRRILQIIPVLFVISLVVFLMLHMIPGDPVKNMLGINATEEAIEAMRAKLGLDQPLHKQYISFMKGVLKGDLGTSIHTRKPVVQEILDKYPYTLKLAVGGTIVATVFGIIFGIIAAVYHNKFMDNFIMVLSLLSVSTPSFFLSLILMLIFSLYLGWLPSVGVKSWAHYVLPVITLGAQSVGIMARTTRSAMLEVLNQDYIRTSRSRGVPERIIIYSHAFKNALIPIVTVIGLRFGGLLAGSALVETVFAIPGIGRLMVDGVLKRDYPVVQGTILVISATFVIMNLLTDLLYAVVDPRVKYD